MRGDAGVAGPAVLLLAALLGSTAPAEEPGGLVVTRVAAGSVAERNGLRPGDRLLRWEQGDASGTLASPFDLDEAELERAPRGAVTLAFEREGGTHAASLWPDDWGLEVRPDLPAEGLAALGLVQQPVADAGFAKAVGVWRSLVPKLPAPADRAWLLLQVAQAEARAGRLAEAEAAASDALREAGTTSPALEAHLWSGLGRLRQKTGRVADATAAFVRALALDEPRGAESLVLASRLQDRAGLALSLPKDLIEAISLQERATALRERLAPRSLAFASSLSLLGRLMAERGDMSEGLDRLRRASALAKSLAPDSLAYARCLAFEANVLMASGGLDEAEPMLRHALELERRREPAGQVQLLALALLAIAHSLRGEQVEAERLLFEVLGLQERSGSGPLATSATLSNLGVVAKARGDQAEAERRYLRALSLLEGSGSGDERAFNVLVNLGSLARVSHDLSAAESYLRRALTIQERQAPESLNMALVLGNLGSVARERGDLAVAEELLRRSLQIHESKAPEAIGTAFHLEQLATVLVARGEIEEAERLLERALAICEKRAPGGRDASSSLQRMGMLQLELGRLDAAEGRLRAALAIRSELAPDSAEEAESSHALGVVLDRQGRREEALVLLRRSVEAIQAQSRRLAGSDDARVAFRAHYQEYHRDLEELLLSLARPEDAFAAAEASRARTLLALMTHRDLDLARDVSPELERERRRADTEHDRVLKRLGAARDAQQRAALRQELGQARHRQDEVRARIRAAAPRLAAVRDPQPLDLSGVRRVVAPDTLILVYSLGGENSRLYAVGPGPEDFAVSRLQVGEVALREEVRRFREAIQTTRGRLRRRDLLNRSQRLGEILLSPVTAQLARAERVLIVPDGALHALPFGALGLPAPGRPHRFLIQAKPIHTASSVTLYVELARPPEAESPSRQVVGFGDPQYPRGSAGDGPQALRSALRSGLRLDPLPWTRSELKALGLLAPEKPQLWLGSEATEERAKALGVQHRIIHFACHGLLDEAFPLESGLALSIPAESKEGGENGLLQAWEIFESLRIDADLVTLSACQTALGKEVAGEGLLGLTWAFQYAGARSVLASLWEVSDASTADLMRHFYGQLGRGVSKAEALRRAQLELLKHPATSAPFYWAAFELIGDWR